MVGTNHPAAGVRRTTVDMPFESCELRMDGAVSTDPVAGRRTRNVLAAVGGGPQEVCDGTRGDRFDASGPGPGDSVRPRKVRPGLAIAETTAGWNLARRPDRHSMVQGISQGSGRGQPPLGRMRHGRRINIRIRSLPAIQAAALRSHAR